MQKLSPNLYNLIAFEDFDVETMSFDEKKKELIIITDGAWLDIGSEPEAKKCRLFFYQWKSLVIEKYYPDNPVCKYLDGESFELLKDLPLVEISESKVRLCGFSSTSGRWIEWILQDVKIQIEYST